MGNLYAKAVLRLIGPALELRERAAAARLAGLYEAASLPTVSAVTDELLNSAGFCDSKPANDDGEAGGPSVEKPRNPSPLAPCDSVAALYEAMQRAAVSAPVALLERSLRVRLTPATLSELDESGPPRTASSCPVNLAGRATAVAPAFGPSAAPGRSMRPEDSDALSTTLSSQVRSPPVVIP
jgi:hypothetical protein